MSKIIGNTIATPYDIAKQKEKINMEINLYSDDAPVWVESSNDEATQYRYGFMTLVENLVLEEGKDYDLSFSIGFQYTYDYGDSFSIPPNFSFVKKTSNDEYVAIGGSVHDTTVTDGVCKGQLTFSEGVGNGDILYLSVQARSDGTFDPEQSGINIDSVGNLEELIHYLNSENQKTKKNIGDIETALDGIIAIQENLIGGETE